MARRQTIRYAWPILVAWCGFLFFFGLSGPLYRTEALRAIIGQESLNGHWLVPTLYGEPFLTKPPGVYVAIAAASVPFGRVTEETARIPSALAATFTVLFAFATFRRFLGARSAFALAMCLPVSVLWLDKAPSAEIDMLQLAWVTAALCCVLRAVEVGAAYPTAWWLAALACVAGGFLTKWTAPAFFYLTIGPLLVWRGQWRLLFGWRHLLAVGLATGLCTAWAVTVAEQVGWDVLRDTVGREATQRFAPGGRGKPYPWVESLTFPAVVLGANAPWSLLALFALRPTFFRQWDARGQLVLQLLHCWAWPNLLFWSLPAQHNVRYVMPICPAFVGLGVMVLLSGESRRREMTRVLLKPRTLFWGGLIAWAVVKIAFVAVVVPGRTAERNARATGTEIARLVPAGEILYLCRLKDEGVLFYYGRPARRFTFDQPPVEGPFYALLLDAEWGMRDTFTSVELVRELQDQQHAPIYLVRMVGSRGWFDLWQRHLPMDEEGQTSSASAP